MKSIEEIISDLPENDRKQVLKRMEELELYSKSRRSQPGHGFWIVTNDFLIQKKHPKYCSVCGSANPRPIGEFCRWCGAHMDQEELDLSGAHASKVYAEVIMKE